MAPGKKPTPIIPRAVQNVPMTSAIHEAAIARLAGAVGSFSVLPTLEESSPTRPVKSAIATNVPTPKHPR